MNEKIEEMICGLTSKFDIATEVVWNSLLRQAPINSTITIGCILISVCFISFATKVLLKNKLDNDLTIIGWVFIVIVALTVFIASFAQVSLIIAGFINPEYWAICKLGALLVPSN